MVETGKRSRAEGEKSDAALVVGVNTEGEEYEPVVGLKAKAVAGKRPTVVAEGEGAKAVAGKQPTAREGAQRRGGFGRRGDWVGGQSSDRGSARDGEAQGQSNGAGANRSGRINLPFAGMRFILHGFPEPLKEESKQKIQKLGGAVLQSIDYDICTHIVAVGDYWEGAILIWNGEGKKVVNKQWIDQCYTQGIKLLENDVFVSS
ncbi:hypothetical protein E2562_008037 [Oryza meyeriana var. granulata]|uniref:BRCT domain-containing protein n=1 Tax=Oryza meyeriana var. granulata TaxID=110450 RepID=A0A6G1DFU2_9ORYZ|nr:hypothetical protein E2562_008037 [Oryza meyeriana var. granulata]